MKSVIKKSIAFVICILSVLFILKTPTSAQEIVESAQVIDVCDTDGTGITKLIPDFELPSKYSSKDLGYTTPVRVQRGDTCWAYSAMATLETRLKHDNVNVDGEWLSPMHLNFAAKEERGLGNRCYRIPYFLERSKGR